MASDSSVGFSHFPPGAFYISLQIRKTQPRRWKKRTNEQTWTWVSSKRKKGEFYVTLLCISPCICRLSRTFILRETSTKPLGVLTHLLTALLPSSHCLLQLTVSFSGQLPQVDYSLLPFFINWVSLSSLGRSFPPPLPLCGLRAKTEKEILWVAPTQTETKCYASCHIVLVIQFNISLTICLYAVKWLNISIWSIDGILIGTITTSRSGPRSNGNEGVLHIPQSSKDECN